MFPTIHKYNPSHSQPTHSQRYIRDTQRPNPSRKETALSLFAISNSGKDHHSQAGSTSHNSVDKQSKFGSTASLQELEVEGGSGSSILFYCEKRDVTFCFTFTFFTFTILLSLFQLHCFTFKMVLLSLFLFVEKSPSHNPSNSNPELSQLLFFLRTNQAQILFLALKNPYHFHLCTEQKGFYRSPFFLQRFTSSLSPSPTTWQTGDQLNGTEKHARTLLFTTQPSPLTDHSPASFSLLPTTSSKFSFSSFSLFNVCCHCHCFCPKSLQIISSQNFVRVVSFLLDLAFSSTTFLTGHQPFMESDRECVQHIPLT